MKHNQEYKDQAREMLKGKYWNYVVASIIYFFIPTAIVAILPQTSVVVALFEGVMMYGFVVYSLKFIHDEQPLYKDCFDAFVGNKFGKVLATTLLVRLFTLLWSLLLIVPGIIKGFGWSQTTYILKENPDRTAKECMKMSEDMMMGHKWEFFKLTFSFFGWYILVGLTAGLGAPLLLPLTQTSFTLYYEDLKKEYNNSHTEIKVETVEEVKKEEPKQEEKKEEPKKIEKKETKKIVKKTTIKKTTAKEKEDKQ